MAGIQAVSLHIYDLPAYPRIQTERSLNPLLVVLRQSIVLLAVSKTHLQHFSAPCLCGARCSEMNSFL